MLDLQKELELFLQEHDFSGKGPLCVALVITEHAREQGLPLDPATLITEKKGQVRGLSGSKVRSILASHGIKRELAKEGGRTSRGSIGNMQAYVDFLNRLHDKGMVDFDEIASFWIKQVQAFFAREPFRLKMDASQSLRAVVRDLLDQAQKRQQSASGMQYAGAMLQHLVGAKLECALGESVEHHAFSTADMQSNRAGDFSIGDVVIHVTMTPSEAVFRRCRDNIEAGLRPLLVTRSEKIQQAEGLAHDAGLFGRIDIFDAEQFIALNLHEFSGFRTARQKESLSELVKRYNAIVENVETDPSLRIEIS